MATFEAGDVNKVLTEIGVYESDERSFRLLALFPSIPEAIHTTFDCEVSSESKSKSKSILDVESDFNESLYQGAKRTDGYIVKTDQSSNSYKFAPEFQKELLRNQSYTFAELQDLYGGLIDSMCVKGHMTTYNGSLSIFINAESLSNLAYLKFILIQMKSFKKDEITGDELLEILESYKRGELYGRIGEIIAKQSFFID